MRWVHRAVITALAKPEEDIDAIRQGIIALVPFSLEEAKVKLDIQNAESFKERIIKIFTIIITKESHTNDFLQFLIDTLSEEQKKLLIAQSESRLDGELDFFIRIEKDKWVKERKIILTDEGYCFHIKLSLAAFPKKRETALAVINKIFTQKNI